MTTTRDLLQKEIAKLEKHLADLKERLASMDRAEDAGSVCQCEHFLDEHTGEDSDCTAPGCSCMFFLPDLPRKVGLTF